MKKGGLGEGEERGKCDDIYIYARSLVWIKEMKKVKEVKKKKEFMELFFIFFEDM